MPVIPTSFCLDNRHLTRGIVLLFLTALHDRVEYERDGSNAHSRMRVAGKKDVSNSTRSKNDALLLGHGLGCCQQTAVRYARGTHAGCVDN